MSWAERWRSVLDGPPDMQRRVRQGRATYRSGRVTDVRLTTGRVSARVQGSRATPFLVEVEIPVLRDADWAIVVDLLAQKVRYSARLLAGHHPEGLLDEALDAGVALIPTRADIAVAAGHSGEDPFPVAGAAIWEAVAARLEHSPFPLLKLRGRGRERILRDVAKRRRSGTDDGPGGVDAADIPVLGWSAEKTPLRTVPVPPIRHPAARAPGLAVLGDPTGWAGAISAADLFGPLIANAASAAEDLLLGPDEEG